MKIDTYTFLHFSFVLELAKSFTQLSRPARRHESFLVTPFRLTSRTDRIGQSHLNLSDATNDFSDEEGGKVGGGLVTQSALKSQLFSAFENLDLTDQYDAVLTGLAAKILDKSDTSPEQTLTEIQSCYELLKEMNQKRITPSPRSVMAMIDSSVKTQSTESMTETMRLCTLPNQYGAQQADLRLFPSNAMTKVRCPDGSLQTASERLAKLPDIPVDDRGKEVAAALAVTSVGGVLEGVDVFTDYDPIANAILTGLALTLVIDNAYDLVKSMTQFVSQQISPDKKAADLPDKDKLPFGLGTGKSTGIVVKGYSRLLTADPEREAECEAAALVTAYGLGLPCFAFRSNSLEATSLVSTADSSSIIFRILVWLMAPVAIESSSYPQLIFSDPNEAEAFMNRCEELFGPNDDRVFWDSSNRGLVLKWAYTEADLLVRENKRSIKEISQRLAGGAATIGDCVAVLENW